MFVPFLPMEISQELRMIGFTPNEVAVYTTLIRIGRAGAARIAKEAGLERSSTYNALRRLAQEALVSIVIEDNKRKFAVEDPQSIADGFRERAARAERLVPMLERLRKFEREREEILKFQGLQGVKKVLNDVLRTCGRNGEYLIFGTEGQLTERLPTFSEIFVAKKDGLRIRAKLLLKEAMRTGSPLSRYTEVRYLPDQVVSPASTNVYGDKVSIIIWKEKPEAIIIDNAQVAASYRSYFEFMWKSAEEA